jgi:DNA-binding SARP family transcriptional activator
MLRGRVTAPKPEPGSPGRIAVDVETLATTAIVELRRSDFPPNLLAAELHAAGRAGQWARLAPFDVDDRSLSAIVARVVEQADATGATGSPVAIVEAHDAGQADEFGARLSKSSAQGRDVAALVIHFSTSPGAGSDNPPVPAAQIGGDGYDRPTSIERLGRRLIDLAGAGVPFLGQLVRAGARLPAGELARLADFSADATDLIRQVTVRLLHDVPTDARATLGLVAQIGYCHERYASMEPVLASFSDMDWWTTLDDGWLQMDPNWRAGVLGACAIADGRRSRLVGRLVSELVEDGATDEAIELCLDAGFPGIASDLLCELGVKRLAEERPEALSRWVGRLPPPLRATYDLANRSSPAGPAALSPPSSAEAALTVVRARRGFRRSRIDPAPIEDLSVAVAPDLPRVDAVTVDGAPVEPIVVDGDVGSAASMLLRGGQPVEPFAAEAPLLGPVDSSRQPPTSGPVVDAHLFGTFDIAVDGRPVAAWRGRVGRMILAFCLLHRERTHSRDALAEVFWPGTTPEAARNRFNVTLHGLRLDLRAVTPHPVVVFSNGYTINPDLDVRIDVEEFERAMADARRCAHSAAPDVTMSMFRDALAHYRDDLLSDLPYAEWTILRREQLRVEMLDGLATLAQITFDARRYEDCVDAGQRLVTLDLCREDVHRLLMRAYARLEQPHRAIRQYRACLRQLGTELDVEPSPETVRLYQLIRARRPV